MSRKTICGDASKLYLKMLGLRQGFDYFFARAIDKDMQTDFYLIDADDIAETRKRIKKIEAFLRELERRLAE